MFTLTIADNYPSCGIVANCCFIHSNVESEGFLKNVFLENIRKISEGEVTVTGLEPRTT